MTIMTYSMLGFLVAACTPEPAQQESPVELVLKVASEHYLLDQPVKIYFGVRNPSAQASKEVFELYTNTPLTIEVSSDGKSWTEFRYGMLQGREGPGMTVNGVDPGKTILHEHDLRPADATNRGVLDEPGKWKVRVRYYASMESNVCEFAIDEPTGRDALAHADLDKKYGSLGMVGGGLEVTRPFPKHLESHPDSGYAGDVAISLVQAWVPLLEMSVDDRKEALKTCQEILAKFEKEWPDHQQAPRALFLRARLERVLLSVARQGPTGTRRGRPGHSHEDRGEVPALRLDAALSADTRRVGEEEVAASRRLRRFASCGLPGPICPIALVSLDDSPRCEGPTMNGDAISAAST